MNVDYVVVFDGKFNDTVDGRNPAAIDR